MSTGNAGVDQHGRDRDRGRRAHGAGQVGGRRGRQRSPSADGTTTTTTCWVPAGPTPTQAAAATSGEGLDPLLDPDRGDRTLGTGDHVHEPALDPEPAAVVQVPDVAGAVPAGRAGARALGDPEPVVAVLDVRGPHARSRR